jgi:adenine deaminase
VNGRVSYNRTLSPPRLIERIRAGKGERPADLVLKRGKVVNVFSGEIGGADVAIHDGVFVGVGPQYHGRSEVDLADRFVAPGLIDGHIHIESTMMTPPRLAEALVVHGTTTIVSDPHEIANVMGMEGIRYMLRESESIPLDVFFTAPSCVPSSHLETSGATLSAEDLRPLREHPRVLGLAEVMNFPGLLAGERGLIEKALLFRGGVIDGHCPGLRGAPLQAYVAAGIRSDHETIDPSEALEKLRAGMMVMIREGTSARNLSDLLPVVTKSNVAQFCFVSDDLHPEDILHRGHMNFVLRKAVLEGLDPVDAIRMVTINPARYFGLNDRGAVAPGLNADCVVFEDLEEFSVSAVYKNGRSVARDGRSVQFLQGREGRSAGPIGPLNIAHLRPEHFQIPAAGRRVRAIGLMPGQLTTREVVVEVSASGGRIEADPQRDLLKLAVVERHHGSGRVGLGLVKGFGLKHGAIASSVAHDAHNIIAVGVTDQELFHAVHEVASMGGGIAVVSGHLTHAKVVLQVAGLMSPDPVHVVAARMGEAKKFARALGCGLKAPFMSLSFLALPVIPELKLTDLGLVNVTRFEIVNLFVD